MVEIKDNYFKANDGNRYFRRNAPEVVVGSYGKKQDPVTQANYLEAVGHIKYDFLAGKIKTFPSGAIDWARARSSDVQASATTSYFDIGGRGMFSHNKAKEAHLELARFYVEQMPLKNILNNEANKVREELKKEGNDARVCSSVWVVISGNLAERFQTSVGLEVSGTPSGDLSITARGGASWSGSEEITLSPGTVFAYGLHKVTKWDGDKIEDMEDDWQSLG